MVNSRALAGVARKLGLGAVIHLCRGEERSGGRDKYCILADTVEALLGAIFLEHGSMPETFVHQLFDPLLAESRPAARGWTGNQPAGNHLEGRPGRTRL